VKAFCARHLWVNAETLIENGALIVEKGKVREVLQRGERLPANLAEVHRFEGGLIIPGLVNAHTHLELSFLRGKVPFRGSFLRWLGKVGLIRATASERQIAQSVKMGLDESLASGTTLIADTFRSGQALAVLCRRGARGMAFLEIIAPWQAQAQRAISLAVSRIGRFAVNRDLRIGIAPHAPYSVSGELLRLLAKTTFPLSIHTAESRAEEGLFQSGKGSLARLLKVIGAFSGDFCAPGAGPVGYLYQAGVLSKRALLVHMNYVTDEEIRVCARAGVNLVACPRSAAFFGHKEGTFRRFIAEGMNIALGTDSLASNSSLSILDEMRFIRCRFPEVSPSDILRMATESGAIALGFSSRKGSLEPGKDADFAVAKGPSNSSDPWERLYDARTKIVCTVLAGEKVYCDEHFSGRGQPK